MKRTLLVIALLIAGMAGAAAKDIVEWATTKPAHLVAVKPGSPRRCEHCGKDFPVEQFATIFRPSESEDGFSVGFGKASMSLECWDAATEDERFEACAKDVIEGWLNTKGLTPEAIDLSR